MHRTLSIRGRYFIAAIAFTMISTLLALFVPLTYGETKYFGLDVDYWFIPFQNYTLFASALGCIVLALIVLGFMRHIASYIVAALLAVSAIIIGYSSFLGLTTIDEDKLFMRTAFDEQTYPMAKHDDIIDAIEMAYRVGQVGMVGTIQTVRIAR